ncbi:hypothetical protein C1H46_006652 [Malus baccata]|uniref:FBD domain-containing protein n=1 Tax=Malus baccata TaxID=106549 RepID=A0A540N9M3_MALBA|nr:hypothetical protein C1H46_006652 [Malus baccata]
MYQTVINRILQLLPTTPAARMSFLSKQWEGLRSSVFVLDFNEGNVHHNFDDQRPRNFIKDWDRYLDQFRENDKQLLYKFKLHMRYFDGDATIVCKWLNFAIERGVNELDISLPKENWEDKVECKPNTKYFCHIPDKFFHRASAWAAKLWEASITLPDIELPTFDCSLGHLSSLRDYLESFDCSRKITLKVHDATNDLLSTIAESQASEGHHLDISNKRRTSRVEELRALDGSFGRVRITRSSMSLEQMELVLTLIFHRYGDEP